MAMVVASCVMILSLHGVSSLKEKRQIVKSLTARLHREFNVSVAEVDYHEVWQTAAIGMVSVGADSAYLHGLLQKAVNWVEAARPDIPIEDYRIEFL